MNVFIPEGGLTVHKNLCELEISANSKSHYTQVCDSALSPVLRFFGCIRDFLNQNNIQNVCVAIGVFDGVHLGHQQVIKKMIADAKMSQKTATIVVTFDRHPKSIIPHSKPPLLIYPLKQKLKAIESLAVQYIALIPFDLNLSRLDPACFVKILKFELGNIRSISVGKNFLFGHNRAGNVALLEEMGKKSGFNVYGLNSVSIDGKTISSTRIREAIEKGDIALASQMLGRDYSILGKVIRGDGIGRAIGFPTANIDVSGLVLPPRGVYAVRVAVKNQIHNAVLNIGFRPTLKQTAPKLRFEIHILDFNAEIYDEEIETIFFKKIRDEIEFESVDKLKEQIKKDIEEAVNILAT